MRKAASLITASFAAAVLIAATEPAAALTCESLEAELARLESQAATPDPRAQEYRAAWQEQAGVLQQAEDRAAAAGCLGGGFPFAGGPTSRQCADMIGQMQRMRANLDRLEALSMRYDRPQDLRRADRVRELLVRRGCGIEPFMAQEPAYPEPVPGTPEPTFAPSFGGSYRTLCVRRCDGYYFPISFATTAERFAQDEAACQSMCPGGDAELYYQPSGDDNPANMMSLSGEPYAALPNAFEYRKEVSAACSCRNGDSNFSIIATPRPDASLGAQPQMSRPETLPQARPEAPDLATLRGPSSPTAEEPSVAGDKTPAAAAEETAPTKPGTAQRTPSEDEETAGSTGSQTGSGDAKETAAKTAPTPEEDLSSSGSGKAATGKSDEAKGSQSRSKVRIVGPVYWGGPKKEGVLVAPVQK
ncbi:hypothetical protein J2R99_000175 [Rhodopseudomonas julia]|uniref:DUF2865 domain-containing protein n=1 Tax=Rhodopseudomonas julia TaxID=200617 RepID=A0ABU0C1E1_9BRAD|nr:DUF2865 domain-containing protein [Rhodopseudomonas julia]MDQ0324326.1 hypothetical protein [Rhodopseudomonas julia]